MLAAAKAKLPIFEYAPAEVKKTVTGSGGASKDQVARWVRAELREVEVAAGRDLTDALAIALCHAERRRSSALRSGTGEATAANPETAKLLARMRGRSRRGRGR